MPDKIHLLLESILQESRASKEEILNIKKEMITHDEFANHTEAMSVRLNDISIQQNKQNDTINSLELRFNKKFASFIDEKYKKVGGTVLFILIMALGMVLTDSAIPQQNITYTNHTTR